MAADPITVYGADWCGDTRRTLKQLDTAGVPYNYINIDDDTEGEKKVIAFSKGKRRIPLVEVGEKSLCVPSDAELASALK
jgi:mycoredoxin